MHQDAITWAVATVLYDRSKNTETSIDWCIVYGPPPIPQQSRKVVVGDKEYSVLDTRVNYRARLLRILVENLP